MRRVRCHSAITTQHRIAPHSTAPRRAAPHCTALHRTALHRTAPHCTALHCTAPHCTPARHENKERRHCVASTHACQPTRPYTCTAHHMHTRTGSVSGSGRVLVMVGWPLCARANVCFLECTCTSLFQKKNELGMRFGGYQDKSPRVFNMPLHGDKGCISCLYIRGTHGRCCVGIYDFVLY